MTPSPQRIRFTPGVFWAVLLVAECLLLYFQPIRRFEAYDHRVWPALSTIVLTTGVIALLGLWFIVARVFRGRFQFGLRTLVLVVVCIAIPFATLAAELQRIRRTRRAVAQVEALGGKAETASVLFFGSGPPTESLQSPKWLVTLLGDDVFFESKYQQLEFHGPEFTDETCRFWREFPRLEVLKLLNTRITDDGLKGLREFNELVQLTIEDTDITDLGLESIIERDVIVLRLANTQITDAGLARLARLATSKSLRILDVRGCRLSPDAITGFRRSAPHCNLLWEEPLPSRTAADSSPIPPKPANEPASSDDDLSN